MIERLPKLLSMSCLFLFSCALLLFQKFDFSIVYACPEPGVATWFIGILELEDIVLAEKIGIVPSYDTNYRCGDEGNFFGFFIFNKTEAPLYILGLDDLSTLVEAKNNNSLSDQINHLLSNERGFQVEPQQNNPIFRLNGAMLKSFDPKIVEHNQFDYALPKDLEIPPPQNSSFVIVSEEEIITMNYQLRYELNEEFYIPECDMDGSSEFESDSTAISPTTNTKIPTIYFVLAGLLIVLICGVVGVFAFKRKSS